MNAENLDIKLKEPSKFTSPSDDWNPLLDDEFSALTKNEILNWASKLNISPMEIFALSNTELEKRLSEVASKTAESLEDTQAEHKDFPKTEIKYLIKNTSQLEPKKIVSEDNLDNKLEPDKWSMKFKAAFPAQEYDATGGIVTKTLGFSRNLDMNSYNSHLAHTHSVLQSPKDDLMVDSTAFKTDLKFSQAECSISMQNDVNDSEMKEAEKQVFIEYQREHTDEKADRSKPKVATGKKLKIRKVIDGSEYNPWENRQHVAPCASFDFKYQNVFNNEMYSSSKDKVYARNKQSKTVITFKEEFKENFNGADKRYRERLSSIKQYNSNITSAMLEEHSNDEPETRNTSSRGVKKFKKSTSNTKFSNSAEKAVNKSSSVELQQKDKEHTKSRQVPFHIKWQRKRLAGLTKVASAHKNQRLRESHLKSMNACPGGYTRRNVFNITATKAKGVAYGTTGFDTFAIGPHDSSCCPFTHVPERVVNRSRKI